MGIRSRDLTIAVTILGLLLALPARAQVIQEFEEDPYNYSALFGAALATVGDNVLIGAPYSLLGLGPYGVGAVYLFSPAGDVLQTFTNPTGSSDGFGVAVAGDGVKVLIGARMATVQGLTRVGAAYLFDASTGDLLSTLHPPNPTANTAFGAAVAMVGQNALVGGASAREVYLFDGTTGDVLLTLPSPNPPGDEFGLAVATLGDDLLVGAPRARGGGKVHLFDGSSGALIRTFSATGANLLGFSLATMGGNIVAGAPGTRVSEIASSGAVYLFDTATGDVIRSFFYPGINSIASMGASVAVVGNTWVLAGAPLETHLDGELYFGGAYLFDATTGEHLQSFRPDAAEPYYFGYAVAALGGNALVGVPGAEEDFFYAAGVAQLFATCATLGTGATCDDGDACTQNDTCQPSGACRGTAPPECPDLGQCYVPNQCDPMIGQCPNRQRFNGTFCEISSYTCSLRDTCQAGVCMPAGGGDDDNDGICNADDICSVSSDPNQNDLDGDSKGDICDQADASLNVHQVRLWRKTGTRQNGRIKLKGEFLTTPTGAFSAVQGVAARVVDGLTLDLAFSWLDSECKQSNNGRIKCRKPGAPIVEGLFRPLPSSTPGYQVFLFSLRFTGLDLSGSFAAPVEATVANRPGVLVQGVDRVGSKSSCTMTTAGMTCGSAN